MITLRGDTIARRPTAAFSDRFTPPLRADSSLGRRVVKPFETSSVDVRGVSRRRAAERSSLRSNRLAFAVR
jgi:hypothetical protein